MRIGIFLLIGFTHFVFSCDLNDTHDLLPVCPFKLFRRKRDIAEYTRWRSNLETTPEFIVKVLDEDFSTVKPKKVVAVNIQPITKRMDKIIVGGAMVSTPPTTALTTIEFVKDYTRFIPPTTTVRPVGTVYLAQVKPNDVDLQKFMSMLPRAKHPQRDESPPAGPQFVTRDSPNARQYAPITPVGFTQRSLKPLTPPVKTTKENYNFRKMMPSRTCKETLTTRAKLDVEAYGQFLPSEDSSEDNSFMTTRSTVNYIPTTHDFESTASRLDTEDYIPKPTERYHNPDKNDKDLEASYSHMFYEDDNELDSNKTEPNQDGIDAYLYKLKEQAQHKNIEIQKSKTLENLDEESDNSMKMPVKIRPSQSNLVSIQTRAAEDNNYNIERTRKNCSMIRLRSLNFNSPRTLPEIVEQLKRWAEESPVAKWVDITDGNFTTMENPIYMIIVDDPSSGQIVTAKQTVMIVAGIQGRDQHAVAAALYVLYQLIERSSSHTDLLTKYRFWIIPVFNPDGYDYAIKFPHRRNWLKNLRQNWDYACKGRESCHSCETNGLRCTLKACYGVNLDRNFEYQWIPPEELRSEHPCGPLYAGERQLSESETRAFTKLLHDRQPTPHTFIAFKEGDVLGVMYPYSHTKKKRAYDDIYRRRATNAARVATSISGRTYVAGQTSEFLPLYAGGIEDWVDGHLGVDNTYSIMMFRHADTHHHRPATEQVVHEAYAAMDTLLLQSMDSQDKPRVALMSRGHTRSSYAVTTRSNVLLLLTLLSMRKLFTCVIS